MYSISPRLLFLHLLLQNFYIYYKINYARALRFTEPEVESVQSRHSTLESDPNINCILISFKKNQSKHDLKISAKKQIKLH